MIRRDLPSRCRRPDLICKVVGRDSLRASHTTRAECSAMNAGNVVLFLPEREDFAAKTRVLIHLNEARGLRTLFLLGGLEGRGFELRLS